MKCVKRGLLFDPRKHTLASGCTEFAQSPQAVEFDEFVRIYFSTRKPDADGQFVSHISFADVDKAMTRVLRTAPDPVIPLGDLGCFDEHGIFPMNVVRHRGALYGYTCGWSRRVSVPVETAIGLAVSDDDGLTFRRIGSGPIMAASPREPFLVGDPFVLADDAGWHMWYIHGTSWLPDDGREASPARVYKIAYARSSDGISWQRDGTAVIADRLNAHECQALPTVLQSGGIFHMYFCYREATDFRTNAARAYRIGYAWSIDMRTWTRDDEGGGIDVSPAGWDSEMLCYPNLFSCEGRIYLLYNGNQFGRHGFGVAELTQ